MLALTHMRTVALCLCVVTLVLTPAVATFGACAGEAPDVVLACYSAAYAERSPELLDRVVADDYTWIAVTVPRAEIYDHDKTVESTLGLFADEMNESVSMEFGGDYKVVDGFDEGTWRIEDLNVMLTVHRANTDEPFVSAICATFYVRKVEGAEPGYEVYREVTFEGAGCE